MIFNHLIADYETTNFKNLNWEFQNDFNFFYLMSNRNHRI